MFGKLLTKSFKPGLKKNRKITQHHWYCSVTLRQVSIEWLVLTKTNRPACRARPRILRAAKRMGWNEDCPDLLRQLTGSATHYHTLLLCSWEDWHITGTRIAAAMTRQAKSVKLFNTIQYNTIQYSTIHKSVAKQFPRVDEWKAERVAGYWHCCFR